MSPRDATERLFVVVAGKLTLGPFTAVESYHHSDLVKRLGRFGHEMWSVAGWITGGKTLRINTWPTLQKTGIREAVVAAFREHPETADCELVFVEDERGLTEGATPDGQ